VVTDADLEKFCRISLSVQDRSEAPLVTAVMMARLVASATRHGLQFHPTALA